MTFRQDRERERREFLRNWYSSRPLVERIRRISKLNVNVDIFGEMSRNPYLIAADMKLKESLSFEDRMIIASVEWLKTFLNKDVSIKEKINEVRIIFEKFYFEHQRRKLMREIDMQLGHREKRIVNYVLKRLNS